MKLKQAIESLGVDTATRIAEEFTKCLGIDWNGGARYVFSAVTNNLEQVPGNIGGTHDDERTVIKKWVLKYKGGYEGRASRRVSNLPGTVADPIIEKIIGSRLSELTIEELNKITYAHRLAMSAENILGLILEEYLSVNLLAHGWHCAWGETIKSVDFVNEDGSFLQIKNRSNSENSSSSAIRSGTQIEKWYRIRAGRVEYMWGDLNRICGTTHLSEESFVDFVRATITENPNCLAVEQVNPWK